LSELAKLGRRDLARLADPVPEVVERPVVTQVELEVGDGELLRKACGLHHDAEQPPTDPADAGLHEGQAFRVFGGEASGYPGWASTTEVSTWRSGRLQYRCSSSSVSARERAR